MKPNSTLQQRLQIAGFLFGPKCPFSARNVGALLGRFLTCGRTHPISSWEFDHQHKQVTKVSQNLGVIKIRIYQFLTNFRTFFQVPGPILEHPYIAAVCEGVHIMFINLAIPIAVTKAVDPHSDFFPPGNGVHIPPHIPPRTSRKGLGGDMWSFPWGYTRKSWTTINPKFAINFQRSKHHRITASLSIRWLGD